jgi:predicted alpha/beta-hydrolase family hydrolase
VTSGLRTADAVLALEGGDVSAAYSGPAGAPVLVLAHGASGSLRCALCTGVAHGLAEAGIGCFRFNFPYAERGDPQPDGLRTLVDAFRRAWEAAADFGTPQWAGGKSIGARIASFAVAEGVPASRLIYLGFPLHERDDVRRMRVAYLYDIAAPMLFVHGSDDELARPDILHRLLRGLGDRATEHVVDGADHSLMTPSGSTAEDYRLGRCLAPIAAQFMRGG